MKALEAHVPQGRMSLGVAGVLAAILMAGALVRVSYFADLRNDPLFRRPAFDAELHDYWARALVTGRVVSMRTVRLFAISTLPSASTERYSKVLTPEPETANGAV